MASILSRPNIIFIYLCTQIHCFHIIIRLVFSRAISTAKLEITILGIVIGIQLIGP